MKVRAPIAAAVALLSLVSFSPALAWPERPIKLIVPFAPGGGTDVVARFVGKALSARLGQQVIIENRPGANGIVGMQALRQSVPDGYTIGALSVGPLIFNAGLYREKLPYSPERDFTPIHLVCTLPSALVVNPKLPVHSIQDLIGYAKTNPGKLNYASAGVGNFSHLAMLLFMRGANVDMVNVPFGGVAPAQQAVIAGDAQLMFNNVSQIIGLVEAGQLRAIGVGEPKRIPQMPNVPAVAEVLPGFEMAAWIAIGGPAGLPRPIIDTLTKALTDALKDGETQQALQGQHCSVINEGPDDFKTHIRNDLKKWNEIIEKAGIKLGD